MPAFNLDPLDESFRRDPFPAYEQARRDAPVLAHPNRGNPFNTYSLFRMQDCVSTLKDYRTFSNVVDMPMPPVMANMDPPDHDRLRALVSSAFTPRMIDSRVPRMREIARQLLDRAARKETVDFVAEVAQPLPFTIIQEIIGVPSGEGLQFRDLSSRINANLFAGLLEPPSEQMDMTLVQTMRQFHAYFSKLAEKRKSEPGDDLITGLVNARVEGSKLSMDELLNMLVLIMVAGNETTQTLIANIALTLLDHPHTLTRLRAQSDNEQLIAGAVDEVLRYRSPVQFIPRVATRDLEIHGQRVKRKDVVLCWLGSANRDPSVFRDPDRFDIDRPDLNRSIPFSTGIHHCLGRNLSRIEGQVALKALLDRVDSFALASAEPLPLNPSIAFCGYATIPMRLQPR